MKKTLSLAGLLLFGAGTGLALPRTVAPSQDARARQADLHPEGIDSKLGTDFTLAGTGTDTSGAPFAYLSLSLINGFAGAARARYGYELVDDQGQPLQAPALSDVISFQEQGQSAAARFRTPALADGFYVARVTAVAKDPQGEEAAEVVHLYLRASRGTLGTLDASSWLAQSQGSTGRAP